MNIILFGPPGVGKSTLIGYLKTHGLRAIDLEDVYPNKSRFQLPNMLNGVVIGAADLNPKRKYNNAVKVLLWMPQKDYDVRRENRDKLAPDKAAQAKHFVSAWDPNNRSMWDYVVDVRGTLPAVAAKIRAILKEHHFVVRQLS